MPTPLPPREPQKSKAKVWLCDGSNPPKEVEIPVASEWEVVRAPKNRWYTYKNRLFYGVFPDDEWADLKKSFPEAKFCE